MKKDMNDLVFMANQIDGALNGLDKFAYDRLNSDNVNLDDLEALNSLIAAIKFMSEKNLQWMNEVSKNDSTISD